MARWGPLRRVSFTAYLGFLDRYPRLSCRDDGRAASGYRIGHRWYRGGVLIAQVRYGPPLVAKVATRRR
jgi:hypothetical protein